MWKPVGILLALMLLCVVLVSVVTRRVVHVNAHGQPLDHPAGFIACPLCHQGTAFPQGAPYEFKCDACGEKFRARRDLETNEIEVNW